jgi:hypothetical protein
MIVASLRSNHTPGTRHFLQPLDRGVSRGYKTAYRIPRNNAIKRKLEWKIVRVLWAWQSTSCTLAMFSAWKYAGAVVMADPRDVYVHEVDVNRVKMLLAQNCSDGAECAATLTPGSFSIQKCRKKTANRSFVA